MKDRIRLNEWEKKDFLDPVDCLVGLRKVEISLIDSNLPDHVVALRTNKSSRYNEGRQAALFGLGLRALLNNETIEFALVESGDFDAIFRRVDGEELQFTPVQLKELVPEKWNEGASLEAIVQKLHKYVNSEDLVVAIYVNRRNKSGQLTLPPLDRLNLAGLYLYGCVSLDQSKWWITGDLLASKREEAFFDYPSEVNTGKI